MAKSVLSGLPRTIYKATKGLFRQGVLRRETPGGVDEYGDPEDATVATFGFEGLLEQYDEGYRVRAGIPQGDVQILIIAGSLSVEPSTDDKINIDGGWYQGRKIKPDPAKATWLIQAFKVSEPA